MIEERTIWTDVISFIAATPGISDYEIVQAAQAQVINPNKKTLVLDMIGSPHYGWQGSKDVPTNGANMEHQEIFYQEYMFQVTALVKKKVNDLTMSGLDVLMRVASFLQSDAGLKLINTAGYGIYRVKEIRTGYFLHDNDVFEKAPNFDFTVKRRQVISSEIPSIDGINGVVHMQ